MSRFIKPVIRYKDMLELPIFYTVMKRNEQNVLVTVDLTGFSATFTMVRDGTTTKKIDGAACVIDPDQVANTGRLQYNWSAGDLDTLGNYKGYVTLTNPSSRPETLPEDPIPIQIKGLD